MTKEILITIVIAILGIHLFILPSLNENVIPVLKDMTAQGKKNIPMNDQDKGFLIFLNIGIVFILLIMGAGAYIEYKNIKGKQNRGNP